MALYFLSEDLLHTNTFFTIGGGGHCELLVTGEIFAIVDDQTSSFNCNLASSYLMIFDKELKVAPVYLLIYLDFLF